MTVHRAYQRPWELSRVLTILDDLRPQVIVEIGSAHGGGLYAWQAIGAGTFGVTLEDHREDMVAHGARMIWSDSKDPETRWLLGIMLNERKPDFVWIDGDHSEAGCRADWELAQMLGARLVGFHDISHPVHGPEVMPVYAEACRGRHHHEFTDPSGRRGPGPPWDEATGTGLVWL